MSSCDPELWTIGVQFGVFEPHPIADVTLRDSLFPTSLAPSLTIETTETCKDSDLEATFSFCGVSGNWVDLGSNGSVFDVVLKTASLESGFLGLDS